MVLAWYCHEVGYSMTCAICDWEQEDHQLPHNFLPPPVVPEGSPLLLHLNQEIHVLHSETQNYYRLLTSMQEITQGKTYYEHMVWYKI